MFLISANSRLLVIHTCFKKLSSGNSRCLKTVFKIKASIIPSKLEYCSHIKDNFMESVFISVIETGVPPQFISDEAVTVRKCHI